MNNKIEIYKVLMSDFDVFTYWILDNKHAAMIYQRITYPRVLHQWSIRTLQYVNVATIKQSTMSNALELMLVTGITLSQIQEKIQKDIESVNVC